MQLVYFVLLIGVLIFVHEFGHFFLAKGFGFKVLRFSLGFGPRAVGFRRGETEYAIAWFPLGGYIKMLGEDPQDQVAPADQGRAFHQKPLWQRYLVVVAGPLSNLLLPVLIYFVFFVSVTQVPAPVVGEVYAGHPAEEAGVLPGDRVVAVDGRPLRYWEELASAISTHPGQALKLTLERGGQRYEKYVTPREQVVPGRLATLERFGEIGISQRVRLPAIGIIDPASPAGRAGLTTYDQVEAVNGVPVHSFSELAAALARGRGESMRIAYLHPEPAPLPFVDLRLLEPRVAVVVPSPVVVPGRVRYETGILPAEFFVHRVEPGSPAEQIGLRAGDVLTTLDGKPLGRWLDLERSLGLAPLREVELGWLSSGGVPRAARLRQQRRVEVDEFRQEQVRFVFGAHNRHPYREGSFVAVDGRLGYGLRHAVEATWKAIRLTCVGYVQIVRGAVPRETVGGPLMMYYVAGMAGEKGWDHFLFVLAIISVSLGLLNLMPIPMLDGGHLLFLTLEGVRRRPLSLRAREVASYVGLVLLVTLMVFAFKNDVVRYWLR